MEKNPLRKRAIFGRRNVAEFLKSGNLNFISEVWVKEGFYGEAVSTLLRNLPDKKIVIPKTPKELDRSFPQANHQGIVLWVMEASPTLQPRNFQEWKESLHPHSGPILLLDRIQDPGNMGSILRTSECFGVRTVVYPERGSCGVTDAVQKISSGAIHYLDLVRVSNLSRVVEELKKKGYWIVATSEDGEEDWSVLPNTEDLAILLGNESEGIKNLLLEESDFVLRIPLYGNISSLNVAVACGIILDRIVNRKVL